MIPSVLILMNSAAVSSCERQVTNVLSRGTPRRLAETDTVPAIRDRERRESMRFFRRAFLRQPRRLFASVATSANAELDRRSADVTSKSDYA